MAFQRCKKGIEDSKNGMCMCLNIKRAKKEIDWEEGPAEAQE